MMEAMTLFHAEKCLHLASKLGASAGLCSSSRQFLIYSTFVLVVCPMLCIAALDRI